MAIWLRGGGGDTREQGWKIGGIKINAEKMREK